MHNNIQQQPTICDYPHCKGSTSPAQGKCLGCDKICHTNGICGTTRLLGTNGEVVNGMLCSSCGDDGKICCLKDHCLLYNAPDSKKNNIALHRCNTCNYFNVHKRCMKLYDTPPPQSQSNTADHFFCILCRNSQPKNFFHPLNQVRIN